MAKRLCCGPGAVCVRPACLTPTSVTKLSPTSILQEAWNLVSPPRDKQKNSAQSLSLKFLTHCPAPGGFLLEAQSGSTAFTPSPLSHPTVPSNLQVCPSHCPQTCFAKFTSDVVNINVICCHITVFIIHRVYCVYLGLCNGLNALCSLQDFY